MTLEHTTTKPARITGAATILRTAPLASSSASISKTETNASRIEHSKI
ncbi:MAG: hypothetical protein KJP15_10645 [Gammaproteobacteria bacterium]|nr:hypothetical protein [Gammaproteobacteria bacterium]